MNLMQKLTRLMWAIVLLLAGCSGGQENWTEFPSYPDAMGTKTYNLKQENARQISYGIDAEYPDLAVVDFYSGHIAEPWVPCFSNPEWQQLINDDSDNKVITVHQVRLHWANFEQDRLLLLGIWYESEGEQAVDIPDNSGQKVDLVEYRDASVTKVIASLGLTCDRGQ